MTGIASDSETPDAPKAPAGGPAIYFDGKSNQRRVVTLLFTDRLEIREDDTALAAWAYADIRRADAPAGMLRLSSLTAAALARLEVRDAAVAADLVARSASLDENTPGRGGAATIVGWSLAAAVSIVAVVLFGVPLAADRLAPLVPDAFERRLGEVADSQVKTLFDAKVCDNAAGQKAFFQTHGRDTRIRRDGYVGTVRRAVLGGAQRLRAAGRQGLHVQGIAREGRERRRDRGCAGA